MDIHYITSYITYKRYNQKIKGKRTNMYIYINAKIILQNVPNPTTSIPTKSLALIQYSLFALLDNLSREDLTIWSKQCCQWISTPLKQLLTTWMDKTAKTPPQNKWYYPAICKKKDLKSATTTLGRSKGSTRLEGQVSASCQVSTRSRVRVRYGLWEESCKAGHLSWTSDWERQHKYCPCLEYD